MPKSTKGQTKKPPKKAPISAKPQALEVTAKPRRVKLPPYRPISLHKRIKPVRPQLSGAFRLLWRAFAMLRRHWRLFLGMLLIYAVLNIVLVHGLANSGNLSGTKSALNSVSKGPSGKASLGFTLFLSLLSGSGAASTNASAGVYQALIVIVVSLAVVWALRQLYNNEPIRIRDGFYRGMYPFVPFILVLLVVGLQLVPLLIGGAIYNIVISNGIAVHVGEKVFWAAVFFISALISLYMICSSLFALYIVTLPDMTPMKALRSARQLVRYRRFIVLRKILFLPLSLLLATAIIVVPISLVLTAVAAWIYFILSLFGLLIVHSYMYGLYRELLQ